MRGLVYEGPWKVGLAECPAPGAPTGGEVLVRIAATGICGTDLGIIMGACEAKVPVVLGHESAGEVVAVGDRVRSLAPGTRVVIDPTFYCGFCPMCRTDRPNHCEHKGDTETGVSRDGTFAPYYKTEERFLYPLAPHVSFEAGSLVEPLSCALTGADRLRARPDMRTLIFGAGPLGILYSHALACRGLGGALVEVSAARRARAATVAAAGWRITGSAEEALEDAFGRPTAEVDVIVDTTGVMVEKGVGLLARGGQLLTIGLRRSPCTIDALRLAERSLSLIGSVDSLGTFASAMHLIESGRVPAERMVTHRFALDDYREAFLRLGCDLDQRTYSAGAEAMKVVLQPA
ncbi:MAG TPA: alcohol dehydrogenase catalytic domain-containing protein [Longimicrobium sp.]|jgi:threonine dehydrogenase-like Zn-dependent dehydrogenase|uniref:zinc-dependent alcohol dehydrogenase n=1 Tax=Longimicrobium sp. TaxID=2029185 RepID=UPI002ED8CD5F